MLGSQNEGASSGGEGFISLVNQLNFKTGSRCFQKAVTMAVQ